MPNSFDNYSVSGLNHNVHEDREIGHGLDHSRETDDWNYNKRFRNKDNSYTGYGPKDFWPSDERIYERVCEALFWDHTVDASEVQVEVEDGVVTLTGEVSDRKAKKNAEYSIENVFGVIDVINKLTLKRDRGLVGSSEGWPV